jgi:hypothetical protein
MSNSLKLSGSEMSLRVYTDTMRRSVAMAAAMSPRGKNRIQGFVNSVFQSNVLTCSSAGASVVSRLEARE